MNVCDFIANYCNTHNINNYALRSKVITLDEFAKHHSFAPSIAFFYKLEATGEIQNVTQFGNNFITVTTNTDFFDFAKIAKISDDGTIQHASSDFIFVADTMLKIDIKQGSNALFNKIYNAQLFYMCLTILSPTQKKNQIQIDYEIEN